MQNTQGAHIIRPPAASDGWVRLARAVVGRACDEARKGIPDAADFLTDDLNTWLIMSELDASMVRGWVRKVCRRWMATPPK